MNDIHIANRQHWEARASEWAKRPEVEKVWRRCAKEPGLALADRELHWLGDVAGRRVAVLGSGDNLVVFALAGMGARVTSVDIAENQWTVSDYIGAVLAAGCEVLALEEFGTGLDGEWEVPPVGRLPRVLLVVGRKRN